MKKVVLILVAMRLGAQPVSTGPEKMRTLGQLVATQIKREAKRLESPEIQGYVARIGAQLVSELNDTAFSYSFEVLTDTDATEPIALPGGFVLVPAGSMMTSRDDREFAASLAHAIAHTSLLRPRQDPAPLIVMGGRQGLHRNKPDSAESEADKVGSDLVRRAGYDTRNEARAAEFRRIRDIVGQLVANGQPRRTPTLRR